MLYFYLIGKMGGYCLYPEGSTKPRSLSNACHKDSSIDFSLASFFAIYNEIAVID